MIINWSIMWLYHIIPVLGRSLIGPGPVCLEQTGQISMPHFRYESDPPQTRPVCKKPPTRTSTRSFGPHSWHWQGQQHPRACAACTRTWTNMRGDEDRRAVQRMHISDTLSLEGTTASSIKRGEFHISDTLECLCRYPRRTPPLESLVRDYSSPSPAGSEVQEQHYHCMQKLFDNSNNNV